MKRIPLTQGKFAIVDDQDYKWLSKHKWFARKDHNMWYAYHNVRLPNGKQTTIGMHREILGLQLGDKRLSDHIHHNGLNNQRTELRIVTTCENMWNRLRVKGYYWHKQAQKFHAQIMIKNKSIFLGDFNTAKEARIAYLAAKQKYHKIAI